MNREGLPPLPPDIAAMVARDAPEPVANEVGNAMLSNICATVGIVPPPATHAPTASTPLRITGTSSGIVAKSLGAKALVVALGMLSAWKALPFHGTKAPVQTIQHGTTHKVQPRHHPVSDMPYQQLPSPTAVITATDALPTVVAVTNVKNTPVHLRPPHQLEGLSGENQLIDSARSALAQRNSASALASLKLHQTRYPHGRLTEERESMRIVALVVAGAHTSAQTWAERFFHRFPGSMFEPLIRASLAQIP